MACRIFIASLFLLTNANCYTGIKKFNYPGGSGKYENYFSEDQARPLKKQWPELYTYLKRGHLLQNESSRRTAYIYSFDLYRFLQKNTSRIYDTPYLQDYNRFIAVFGPTENVYPAGDKIHIAYYPVLLGDPCETCQHDGFGFFFDRNTHKLRKR